MPRLVGPEQWLTAQEAGALIRRSAKRLKNAWRSDALLKRAVRFGQGKGKNRAIFFEEKAFGAWQRSRAVAGAA